MFVYIVMCCLTVKIDKHKCLVSCEQELLICSFLGTYVYFYINYSSGVLRPAF